jgi:hypothetical protein
MCFDMTDSMLAPPNKRKQAKKRKQVAPVEKFAPQKTAFKASHVCWDVVLSNQHAAAVLGSWRWLGVLAQVFGCGAAADQMALWLCGDGWGWGEGTKIWKKKANELFALTVRDLKDVPCIIVSRSNFYRGDYETHLMPSVDVLQLALVKHGGTVAGINAAFLARKARNAKRKRRGYRRYAAAYESDDY